MNCSPLLTEFDEPSDRTSRNRSLNSKTRELAALEQNAVTVKQKSFVKYFLFFSSLNFSPRQIEIVNLKKFIFPKSSLC